MTSIDVISAGGFSDPINVTVRPLTVGQYQALGAPGCNLDSGDDPAERKSFMHALASCGALVRGDGAIAPAQH